MTNDRKTARDVSVDQEAILQILDNEMAHQYQYNERKVKKVKEKSLIQLEKRLKALAKIQQKAEKETASIINKTSLEDLEMRLEQLLSLPKASVSPSNSVTSSVTHSSTASKFSDLVFRPNSNNSNGSISGKSHNNNNKNTSCIYSSTTNPVARFRRRKIPPHHHSMGSLSSSTSSTGHLKGKEGEEVNNITYNMNENNSSRHLSRKVKCNSTYSIGSVSSVQQCFMSQKDILFAPKGEMGKLVTSRNNVSSNVSMAPTLRFKASPWLHVFHD